MSRPRARITRSAVAALLVPLALVGCSAGASSGSGGTGPGDSAGSGTPTYSPTVSIPPKADWCATYTTITKVLAQMGDKQEAAESAIKALATFDQLWAVADDLGILTPAEVEANRRAVAAYVEVEKAIAAGAPPAQVQQAKANLMSVTEKDREPLTSSSDRIIQTCGGVTATPSAS